MMTETYALSCEAHPPAVAYRLPRRMKGTVAAGAMLLIAVASVGCGSAESSGSDGRGDQSTGADSRRTNTGVDSEPMTTEEIERVVTEVDRYQNVVGQHGGRADVNLDFSYSDITDDDLAAMVFPDSVRSINLTNTKITDAGLKHLKRATGLEKLMLKQTQITDAGIEHLKQMPRLTQVFMDHTAVSRSEQLAMMKFLAPRMREQRSRREGNRQ